MTGYLERARVARAVKARVLSGGGDAPVARRDTHRTPANGAETARDEPRRPDRSPGLRPRGTTQPHDP